MFTICAVRLVPFFHEWFGVEIVQVVKDVLIVIKRAVIINPRQETSANVIKKIMILTKRRLFAGDNGDSQDLLFGIAPLNEYMSD